MIYHKNIKKRSMSLSDALKWILTKLLLKLISKTPRLWQVYSKYTAMNDKNISKLRIRCEYIKSTAR